MVRLIAALFVAALAVGLSGCTSTGLNSTTSSNPSNSTSIANANKEIVPAYEHYDTTAFCEICDVLAAQSSSGSANKALATFDKAIGQLGYLSTLESVIYITYCEDASNKENEEEYSYTANTCVECADRLSIAAHALATGPHADAFRTHLANDKAFEDFLTYEPMSEEEKMLSERETDLVTDYYDITANPSDYAYEYKGHEYTLDSLDSDIVLVALDDEEYLEVYDGCLKKLNEAAGAVFTELVSVRTQIAQMNGHEDYCSYADNELYFRDYTEADLDLFRRAVKTFSVSGQMDDMPELYESLPDYDVTATKLLDDVGTVVERVSPYASDALSYLRENNLSSIGSEENRLDAGYTASLYSPIQSAFVFNHTYGNSFDLDDMIHELGHFTRMTRPRTGAANTLLTPGCLDVAEIHSTGLELLSSRQFSALMSEHDAETMSSWLVSRAIENVVQGCIYDEWQRIVYRNPTMGLDDVNETFRSTLAAYGMDTSDASAYSWVGVSHNFDSPLYYISYATSYFASLQLWDMAGTDARAAAALWEKTIDSPLDVGYTELCESVGLASISDANAVVSTLSRITAQVKDLP